MVPSTPHLLICPHEALFALLHFFISTLKISVQHKDRPISAVRRGEGAGASPGGARLSTSSRASRTHQFTRKSRKNLSRASPCSCCFSFLNSMYGFRAAYPTVTDHLTKLRVAIRSIETIRALLYFDYSAGQRSSSQIF